MENKTIFHTTLREIWMRAQERLLRVCKRLNKSKNWDKISALKNKFSNIIPYLLLGLAACIWLLIARYGSFGDEQENFTAGWLLSQGYVPYRDFFYHHAPLPFFLGVPLYRISFEPWLWYRLLVFGWYLACGLTLMKLSSRRMRNYLGFLWIILAISSPYFQSHQYLAESLITPILVGLVWLVFSTMFEKRNKLIDSLIWWIFSGWVAVWSTIVSIPAIGWSLVGLIFLHKKHVRGNISHLLTSWKKLTIIIFALQGSLLSYFILNRNVLQAWWSVITYNVEYYFPLRLARGQAQIDHGYVYSIVQNSFSFWFEQFEIIGLATITALQTGIGLTHFIFKGGNTSIAELLIVWQEWAQRALTMEGLIFILSCSIFIWLVFKKQWRLSAWWIVWLIMTRSRDNEFFKLAPYALAIVSVWFFVIMSSWSKSNFIKRLTLLVPIFMWICLVTPKYQELLSKQPPIIEPRLHEETKLIKSRLPKDATRIYLLGRNTTYYLLLRIPPAHRFFYYHPWFHYASPIKQEVMNFLKSNTEHVVLLEFEINGADMEYAKELEEFVRSHYTPYARGVYTPVIVQ